MKGFALLLFSMAIVLFITSVLFVEHASFSRMLRVKNIVRLEQEVETTRFGMEEDFENAVMRGIEAGKNSGSPEVFACLAIHRLGFEAEPGYIKGYNIDEVLTKAVVLEQSTEKLLAEGYPDILPLVENCVKFVKYEDKCISIGINTNYAFEEPVFSLGKTGFVLKKERTLGEVSAIIPEGRVFCEKSASLV